MSEAHERYLQHRINEQLHWMRDNEGDDVTEQDALDHLLQECGQVQHGDCLLAGSEYCDFACPFRDEGVVEDEAGAAAPPPPAAGEGER